MVEISKIEQGVAAYLDAEVMPQLPATGVEKLLTGTALGLFVRRSGQIIESFRDNKVVQMLGIFDKDGNLDVDVLSQELKKNIPDNGIKIDIPVVGTMTFHKGDVDKLYDYITLS